MIEFFSRLSMVLINGYTYTTILVLIVLLIIPMTRSFTWQWLDVCNIVLLVVMGIYWINWIQVAIQLSQLQSEEGEFVSSRLELSNPYGSFFWIHMVSVLLLSILFFFSRYRRSVVLTILALIAFNFEKTMMLITSAYRDYLPSSWSISYKASIVEGPVSSFLVFNMLVAVIYFGKKQWIIHQKGKVSS